MREEERKKKNSFWFQPLTVEQKDSFAAFHWQSDALVWPGLNSPPSQNRSKYFFSLVFGTKKRPENVAFWHSVVPFFSFQPEFYFFLPKKLNLFSRSFSLPSLARMVTALASPEPGEMGGMVMARLRPRGPPGDSPEPDGMEARMEVIQEVISAWTHNSCRHSHLQWRGECRPPRRFQRDSSNVHFFTKNTI